MVHRLIRLGISLDGSLSHPARLKSPQASPTIKTRQQRA
jgi:hypothetical protein